MALCRTCNTVIPCHCHLRPPTTQQLDLDAIIRMPRAEDIDAMAAEIRRLRARVAELERLVAPRTPRLCQCGHSHRAHTVPAPHSCFAYGKSCPCEAYQQLPHDEAVAQLERNRQAAAERAAAVEVHVVADDSDDTADTFTGTQQCGHDDYHGPHPWHDRPNVWRPGISDADDAVSQS